MNKIDPRVVERNEYLHTPTGKAMTKYGKRQKGYSIRSDGTTKCKRCGQIKGIGEFYKSNCTAGGISYVCKECAGPKVRRQARQYRNKLTSQQKVYRQLKNRAKGKGILFDLELSDIKIPAACPVLGIPLDGSWWGAKTHVDKFIPEDGYVKGNITIMSARANQLKSNATIEEIIALAEWMKSYNQLN